MIKLNVTKVTFPVRTRAQRRSAAAFAIDLLSSVLVSERKSLDSLHANFSHNYSALLGAEAIDCITDALAALDGIYGGTLRYDNDAIPF